MNIHSFKNRHIGPSINQINEMLQLIGVSSLDELIDDTIPTSIKQKKELNIGKPLSEYEFINHLKRIGSANKVYKTYIGLGYHNTILPAVIQRNILENPGWYTAYTPYQAEISQGRLEALLNYQTAITELTQMEISNASLLDEATACAEAMLMLYNARSRNQKKEKVLNFFVSNECLPQTIHLLTTRAKPLGINLTIGNHKNQVFDNSFFGCIVQYPSKYGEVYDYSPLVQELKKYNIKLIAASDLLSLCILKAPGNWGADVVVGSSQRFGIPMGYGGPHAAFFATKEEFKRHIPGRIIGVSIDKDGKPALRMALQTREQHIKKDKATSNICTAQVLLAVMAGMYAVYHGKKGLESIAKSVHSFTKTLYYNLKKGGIICNNKVFFDTLCIQLTKEDIITLKKIAEKENINFYYEKDKVLISLNETTNIQDVEQIINIFNSISSNKINFEDCSKLKKLDSDILIERFLRQSNYLTDKVFNSHHSETKLMRYIKKLERKDLSLNHSMIPLGSCTMKLNAATELLHLSWSNFADIHPFVPLNQAKGYQLIINELEKDLENITGFDAVSLQPNSGAQGEYAGLMTIKAYHEDNNQENRNIALIPISAHGTNPASAVMAGMKVVPIQCHKDGDISIDDLKEKASLHANNLSCLMVTYPSTHGVYEDVIQKITGIIHEYGGLVYMDGANMNAQVGLTNPFIIGADVCHLNLHKTFAIPHGGGGPGMGPIGVTKKLAPYLPSNPVIKTGGKKAIKAISAAPWGSAFILPISYGYIKMLGSKGLKSASEIAILNANYIKTRIEKHFDILYVGKRGRAAHELIIECRNFTPNTGVSAIDIAKRLMDYGYHAPTVSFPVSGTLMIEPTESEDKDEIDKFCDALINIKKEIDEIKSGDFDKENNVIKNAPHTLELLTGDTWNFPYSRSKAAFPLQWVEENKFWPSVRRIDDAYGDRNLICTCAPIEAYQ